MRHYVAVLLRGSLKLTLVLSNRALSSMRPKPTARYRKVAIIGTAPHQYGAAGLSSYKGHSSKYSSPQPACKNLSWPYVSISALRFVQSLRSMQNSRIASFCRAQMPCLKLGSAIEVSGRDYQCVWAFGRFPFAKLRQLRELCSLQGRRSIQMLMRGRHKSSALYRLV